jgi:hypothetical protein
MLVTVSGDVYANGRRIIHAGDGQTFVAASPDVCKTPAPSGPTPVPYPNTAKSKDLVGGSRKVTIEGHSVAIEGAKLRTSTGDEAGSGGGVFSNKTKGSVTWGSCSLDVRFEGKGVLRFFEPTLHNGNMSNAGGSSPGDNYMMPPHDPRTKCLHCGKQFEEHEFPVLHAATGPYDAAIEKFRKKHDAHMVGGLDVACPGDLETLRLLAYAGDMPGWLNTNSPIYNFKSGDEIKVSSKDRQRLERGPGCNPIGNCVEQKVLHQTWIQSSNQFPFHCHFSMGVGYNLHGAANTSRGRKTLRSNMQSPCRTCREIMMAMLCQNKPKAGSPR